MGLSVWDHYADQSQPLCRGLFYLPPSPASRSTSSANCAAVSSLYQNWLILCQTHSELIRLHQEEQMCCVIHHHHHPSCYVPEIRQ